MTNKIMEKYREDNNGQTPEFTDSELVEFSIKQKNYALFYSMYAYRAKAVDWFSGQEVDYALADARKKSPAADTNFHHVFAKNLADKNFGAEVASKPSQRRGADQYVDSVANIAIIEGGTNRKMSDIAPDAALKDVPDEWLAQQACVGYKTVNNLASAKACIFARAKLLAAPDAMNWFITLLTNLPDPSTVVAPTPVAAEDALTDEGRDVVESDAGFTLTTHEVQTSVDFGVSNTDDDFDQTLFDSVCAAQS